MSNIIMMRKDHSEVAALNQLTYSFRLNKNQTSHVSLNNNYTDPDINGTDVENYVVSRLSAEIQIFLYSLIFLLAVVGNVLVMVTLFQNQRMRTVTNVFLLNLALSDMLLAVFCIPFTLVPVLLRNFIFGAVMCVLIRYLQAVSVGASCFTLVAISLERYFAICRPLHSRAWQTLSHAYRCIVLTWVLAAGISAPVAVFQKHTPISNHAHSCREIWPNKKLEQAYTVLLDLALLVVPLLLMTLAYLNVIYILVHDVRPPSFNAHEQVSFAHGNSANKKSSVLRKPAKGFLPHYRKTELRLLSRDSIGSITSMTSVGDTCLSRSITLLSHGGPMMNDGVGTESRTNNVLNTCPVIYEQSSLVNCSSSRQQQRVNHRVRHTNKRLIRQNKIRVIRMLFVVVLEFFVCWTPVFVLQTWMIFHVESAYEHFTPLSKSLLHLLSYSSSCCNPITYCFMNRKFREGFVRVFKCKKPPPPIRERQRQQLLFLQDSRQDLPREINTAQHKHQQTTSKVTRRMRMNRANTLRQFHFSHFIEPIQEHSHEDALSQS